MEEIIKVTINEQEEQLVSAKELYDGLGLRKKNWSRWYLNNILNNEFFNENIDWIGVPLKEEGNETMDFAISVEFAKHLSMMARTKKSHEFRNYFIECEKKLREVTKKQLPKTYIEALRELLKVEEEKEKLVLELEEAKPKVESYNKFMDSDGLYTVTNAAKMLGVKPRAYLFPLLRKKGYLYQKGTTATQNGLKKGLKIIVNEEGHEMLKVTSYGVERIKKLIENDK